MPEIYKIPNFDAENNQADVIFPSNPHTEILLMSIRN